MLPLHYVRCGASGGDYVIAYSWKGEVSIPASAHTHAWCKSLLGVNVRKISLMLECRQARSKQRYAYKLICLKQTRARSEGKIHASTASVNAIGMRSKLTAVGFEPTPLRTGALSQRLRPLGQTVIKHTSNLTTFAQMHNLQARIHKPALSRAHRNFQERAEAHSQG